MRLESVFLFSLVIQAFSGVNVKCNCSFDLYLLSPQVWGRATLVDYCRNERHSDLVDQTPCSFQCCPLSWRQATPGERRNLQESCSPGNLPEKASSAAVQTWPNSSGSKGNSWGVGGGNRVYKNIVSPQSKELWGICALEKAFAHVAPRRLRRGTEDPRGKFCWGRKPSPK